MLNFIKDVHTFHNGSDRLSFPAAHFSADQDYIGGHVLGETEIVVGGLDLC